MITTAILAAILTVNFETAPSGTYATNAVYDGLRFSPLCLFEIETVDTKYISVDNSNNPCGWDEFPANSNNYLGDVGGLYVDHMGSPFNLHSLDGKGYDFLWYRIYGSGGQVAEAGFGTFEVNWTNLTWFILSDLSDQHQKKHGWDNIRWSAVDSPGTAVLTGIAGLLLFGFSRRMR